MEEKIVLSYPAEMEDDCLNWSYDQIGNIKADHWVARVITCLGVAGFIYNVKNADSNRMYQTFILETAEVGFFAQHDKNENGTAI